MGALSFAVPARALLDAASNSPFYAWTGLLGLAAMGMRAEETKLGSALSAPIVTMAAALALANLGLLPASAPAYGAVTNFLLPLAVPLLLLDADLKRIGKGAAALLPAFVLGSAGTVLGTFVAAYLVPLQSLGADGPVIAAALAARHIGGKGPLFFSG